MDLEEVPYCRCQRGLYVSFRSWYYLRGTNPTLKGEIDKDEKKAINVSTKSFCRWFTCGKSGSDANLTEEPEQEPVEKEHLRFSWRKSNRRSSILESSHPEVAKSNSQPAPRPSARRSATMQPETTQHPGSVKLHSESAVTCRTNPSPSTRSQTTPVIEIVSPEVHSSEGIPFQSSKHPALIQTFIVNAIQAPAWILNAINALDFLTGEHPRAMSVLSAILITFGSLPAIPAISAGAGGAVLASGAVQAVSAIAVGFGQALSISVKNQSQNQGNSNVIAHQK